MPQSAVWYSYWMHPAVAHEGVDERRVADQRRQPAGEERVAAADMRVERTQRQQVADGADLHVDHEQQLEQQRAEPHRIADDRAEVGLDHRGEARRAGSRS